MQNRYAGDVGDFGKLGMLRLIEKAGLSIGVNWYLVEDEAHNNDGKHIGYLEDKKFAGCDDELLCALKEIICQGERNVKNLEQKRLLTTKTYFSDILHNPRESSYKERDSWHRRALKTMQGCDVVFLDPDNGLLPPSVSRVSDKSIKYVLPEEIIDYYKAGHSIVFYNHRTREQLEIYLKRFAALFESESLQNAVIRGVSYKRGTVRDYFFILQEEHIENVQRVLEQLSRENWGKHFQRIV